ncbi:hypothetical protein AYO40_04920 [Planctomycetaceae bacterium SCGC AG-212-D15]|nr:hypothetical protein AYO40_04920 [Planctomycetaceae bacterium SCGC AG-212-D15]
MKREKLAKQRGLCVVLGSLHMVLQAIVHDIPTKTCERLWSIHCKMGLKTLANAGFSENEAEELLDWLLDDVKAKDYSEVEWRKIDRVLRAKVNP